MLKQNLDDHVLISNSFICNQQLPAFLLNAMSEVLDYVILLPSSQNASIEGSALEPRVYSGSVANCLLGTNFPRNKIILGLPTGGMLVCELQEQQRHCKEQRNPDCSLFEDGVKLIYDDSNSAGRRALQCVGCKLKGVSIALSYDDPAGKCEGSSFPLLSLPPLLPVRCPMSSCFRSWSCSASRRNVLKPLDQHQLTLTAAATGSVGVTGGPPPPPPGHFTFRRQFEARLNNSWRTALFIKWYAVLINVVEAQYTTLLLPYYVLHVATLVLELNYVVIRVATAVSWTGSGGKSGNHRRRTSTVRTLATLAYITFNLLIMIGAEFGTTKGAGGGGLLWRAEYPPFWHRFSTMMG
ncbi:conserved hypothetical protein [Culex quinquefasciatus]|uniref:Uncharacterized protein n=1 Tax=Culex quinquefasciatus TaxID=7176 RepID=B0WFS2_CULQU|nr:conserved hypothetical protein [Culex quinquefasciatus]|eukprot:XP_001847556.1 conserved hypothetical protein [Culex quinquefasciatus]